MSTATTTKPQTARPDIDIAVDVEHALDLDRGIPGGVHATVVNGEVTLTGRVHWMFQKIEAADVARRIAGVRGVKNQIDVKPGAVTPPDEVC